MHRVVTDEDALEQVAALPDHALPAYAEVLALLEIAPDRGRPYNATRPDRPMRELVFGPGDRGAVTYLVLDREQEVHVLLVQWVG